MRIIFSKQAELGIKAVLYLSVQPKGYLRNATEISKELKVPKEFVAKILQKLTHSGIVASRKGKTGGFSLLVNPKEIKIIDIIRSIDGNKAFEECVLGFENCGDENPCPIHHKWAELREKILEMFSEKSIADFRDATLKKLRTLK
ncbi:MAG: Rrf2 family transcriptional regulator [Ignavibacteria bacterium]|nr:Rrf2 family transcriptional regulator [Ignavibacteria bacterium]